MTTSPSSAHGWPHPWDVAAAAALIVSTLAGGCAAPTLVSDRDWQGPAVVAAAPGPEQVRILPMYAGESGTPIGWDDLMDAVGDAHVIVIGEQHDDGLGHAVQRAIVEDAAARWPAVAVSMEMLERDEQPIVDDYFEGIIDAKQFARLTLSQNWGGPDRWPDWYQPIVDAARTGEAEVIAANAPRRYVRLARQPAGETRLAGLPKPRRDWVDRPLHPVEGPYRDRFWSVMQGAGRPEATPTPAPTPASPPPPEHEPESQPEPEPEATLDPDATAPAEADPDTPAAPTSQPESEATLDPDATASAEAGQDTPAAPTSQPESEATLDPDATAVAEADQDASVAPTSQPDRSSSADDDPALASDPDPTDAAPAPVPTPEETKPPPAMGRPMTDEEIAALFRSQLVWDATMAESVARARRAGARKVIHLVGQFHSDFEGGTVQELRRRRPTDRILVISMQRAWPATLRDADRGRADIVVYTGERPVETEDSDAEASAE